MADAPVTAEEIRETDIVFDCPHCGKSLAIDYRGAGLTIPCSDCGNNVQVPIPDGMEITDFDSTEEEQEIRILHLRRALSSAELNIEHLRSELDEITDRRNVLEKARTDNIDKCGTILEITMSIKDALDEISSAVKRIGDLVKEE